MWTASAVEHTVLRHDVDKFGMLDCLELSPLLHLGDPLSVHHVSAQHHALLAPSFCVIMRAPGVVIILRRCR